MLLSELEVSAAQAVFSILDDEVDTTRSLVTTRDGWVVAAIFAHADRHCPFELMFGRGPNDGRFNFFVGLGADFHNYEELTDDEAAAETAWDVEVFLSSDVVCTLRERRGRIARATYEISLLRVEGRPILLACGEGGAWFSRTKVRRVHYSPWVKGSDRRWIERAEGKASN